MQNPVFSSVFYDENDDDQPQETTPLISQSGLGSRRVRSYSNALLCSSKRRLRLKTHLSKPADPCAEEPSPRSPSSQSHSTLVPCSAKQDAISNWQSSCGPSQDDLVSLGSSSSSRNRHESLLSKVSLTLENHGSVARDHLASERTFLAYVRTSLAIASSGVALVQLFTVASANLRHYPEHRLHTYIRPLGAFTIVMGLVVLVIGVVRYFSVQVALTKGHFPVARVVTSFITSILIMLVIATFGLLVAGKLEPPKGGDPDTIIRF
ncbi:hypothetical protein C0991_003330 [Blastosporella zonata]|nr:hypothetical protein C0991_003330 [Blastosporella zonata]